MDEKTKLYVFEKKEVALIFIFMILIAVTSFMFGVRVGKNYSYQASGFTTEDKEKVDLLSGQEEMVNQVVKERTDGKEKDVTPEQLKEKMHETLKAKIMDELNKEERPKVDAPVVKEKPVDSTKPLENRDLIEDSSSTAPQPNSGQDSYTGKFTIQLSSHRSRKEASEFAGGFTIRGYDPIINEVQLSGRGTWYRVSLGVFDTANQAKNYIAKEKELFQGQDYVIGRFD
ncbi:MAG: SPOR domain-containing protein [Bacteriovoracaceae bacterium]|nr:SPOR domain-containing protein [Bacteriovoracaceae bacterium]